MKTSRHQTDTNSRRQGMSRRRRRCVTAVGGISSQRRRWNLKAQTWTINNLRRHQCSHFFGARQRAMEASEALSNQSANERPVQAWNFRIRKGRNEEDARRHDDQEYLVMIFAVIEIGWECNRRQSRHELTSDSPMRKEGKGEESKMCTYVRERKDIECYQKEKALDGWEC